MHTNLRVRAKVLVGLLVAVVVAGFLWHGRQNPPSAPAPGQIAARERAMAPVAPGPAKVRRLSPDDRRKLGDDIHAAIRRAPVLPSAPTAPGSNTDNEPLLRLEDVGPGVKAALEASIPEFSTCYEGKTTSKTPIAIMELVTDPDLGTVIDSPQMTDADGTPLPKDIEQCLRDTAASMVLPPLGKPGRLPIQYSFEL